MLRAFITRLLLLVPLVAIAALVTFTLFSFSPSDPAEIAIRVNAMVPTPELIAQTRHELGLDLPFWSRFGAWVSGLLQGDLGRSYVTGRDIVGEFALALPATLQLALSALAIIVTTSLALGRACATHEGQRLDRVIRAVVFMLSAMPTFWIGLLLIDAFSLRLGWLPTSGRRGADSLILPAVTLSLLYIPTYVRLIRTEMIQTAHENWVLAARARGVPARRLSWRIFFNSLRGSLTALGMSLPKLMAGAFVVEMVFAWPGVGRLCVEAIFNRDIPVVQAYVLMMATLFIVFNLLADTLVASTSARRHEREAL